ncbi:MAG: protein of unknown function with transrane region [Parcubacteria group bacterium]|nr:protein of unknown function with transrane region [Parcubacteria group bacterium]
MADLKKPESSSNIGRELFLFLLVLYFLMLIFQQADYYFNQWGYGSVSSVWGSIIHFFVSHFKGAFFILGLIVCIGSIIGIFYSQRKFRSIVKEEQDIFGHGVRLSPKLEHEEQIIGNPKWERVVEHSNSINSADWRLAIIEADIMLDEILIEKGYHGDSLGERLKSIDKSDLLSLDNAWEAHKTRNQIAHLGADFNLSERDTKRTVSLYESVFKEFKVI